MSFVQINIGPSLEPKAGKVLLSWRYWRQFNDWLVVCDWNRPPQKLEYCNFICLILFFLDVNPQLQTCPPTCTRLETTTQHQQPAVPARVRLEDKYGRSNTTETLTRRRVAGPVGGDEGTAGRRRQREGSRHQGQGRNRASRRQERGRTQVSRRQREGTTRVSRPGSSHENEGVSLRDDCRENQSWRKSRQSQRRSRVSRCQERARAQREAFGGVEGSNVQLSVWKSRASRARREIESRGGRTRSCQAPT